MNPKQELSFAERVMPYAMGGAILSPFAAVPLTLYETYHYGFTTAFTIAFCTLLVSPSGGFGVGIIAKFGIEKFATFRQRKKARE